MSDRLGPAISKIEINPLEYKMYELDINDDGIVDHVKATKYEIVRFVEGEYGLYLEQRDRMLQIGTRFTRWEVHFGKAEGGFTEEPRPTQDLLSFEYLTKDPSVSWKSASGNILKSGTILYANWFPEGCVIGGFQHALEDFEESPENEVLDRLRLGIFWCVDRQDKNSSIVPNAKQIDTIKPEAGTAAEMFHLTTENPNK